MRAELTEKAQKEMLKRAKLERRGLEILDLVAAEWKSDPMSVQCFDARIVKEAIEITEELKTLTSFF